MLTTKNEPLFVSAVDSDIGDNARLIYGIVDKDKDILEKFSVDQFSGAISFKQAEKNTNVPLLDQYEFKVSQDSCFFLTFKFCQKLGQV